MPHRTAIHDQHVNKQPRLTKDEIAERYGATDDLNGATGKKVRADRTHVAADVRDTSSTAMSTGGSF